MLTAGVPPREGDGGDLVEGKSVAQLSRQMAPHSQWPGPRATACVILLYICINISTDTEPYIQISYFFRSNVFSYEFALSGPQ